MLKLRGEAVRATNIANLAAEVRIRTNLAQTKGGKPYCVCHLSYIVI
jgi:hypothetical protein